MAKNGRQQETDGKRDGEPTKMASAPPPVSPAVTYGQSFPFAKQFLQCPVPVGELAPREQWMVRIDGTFTGRRAKVLLSIKAASIANRYSEKRALDLFLDILADGMGF